MPMIGARFYTQLDAAQVKCDVLEGELAKVRKANLENKPWARARVTGLPWVNIFPARVFLITSFRCYNFAAC